jgi:hypothetical protein
MLMHQLAKIRVPERLCKPPDHTSQSGPVLAPWINSLAQWAVCRHRAEGLKKLQEMLTKYQAILEMLE